LRRNRTAGWWLFSIGLLAPAWSLPIRNFTAEIHKRTSDETKKRRAIYITLDMASFEPSLSVSGMRPPLASADAPSMADSLPSVNFGFEDLRNRMAQFTARFDAFIERGRKQVLEERNQFRINLAEFHGKSPLFFSRSASFVSPNTDVSATKRTSE
jgi:hypothetical protein